MNCHQILSGACNSGDRCFAVGSVEGIPFTVSLLNNNLIIKNEFVKNMINQI